MYDDEGCPDVLCDDCHKYCEMKKIMKLVSEGLDVDKIAEEIEQDIKEQKEVVTIASLWEKRDETPYELKVSKEIETNPIVSDQKGVYK